MTTLDLDALERAARAAAQAHAPFEIKDGPDYAEVIDRNGEQVALTVRPELFRLIEQFPALVSDYRALQERVEGAEKDEWQAIETAPKDGQRIDLWIIHQESGARRVADAFWNGTEGEWQIGQYHTGQFVCRPVVTHWRPLPEPPARTKAGEPHEQE